MLTVLLLLWPVAAALLLHFFKGSVARVAAFGAALIEFVLAAYAAITFNGSNADQFSVNLPWIASAELAAGATHYVPGANYSTGFFSPQL
jgi:NADH-quinone oxidoreductase subunit M